jgi:hypothetical protein
MKPFIVWLILFTSLALKACKDKTTDKPVGADGWLKGDKQEKFETVAKQLRGLDMAMVETGYRYTELYWAGQDENWDYAQYQLDKIKVAIENGIERRPKRAQTAQVFLQQSIPAMKEATNKADTAAFNQGFRIFQTGCRSCHIAEKVPFIQSVIPQVRLSAIKFTKE